MSETKKSVRKKAANRREPEPTIQKPKGEVTTTTTKRTKSGKVKTTTKKTNLRKKAGGRPKTGEPNFNHGQRVIMAYLLGEKATIAARAIDRDVVWKNIQGHKSSCQTLRDKGMMERSDLENGQIKLYLTKAGAEAARKYPVEEKVAKVKARTTKSTKKVAKKRAAKK